MKSPPKRAEETEYPPLQFDSHVTAYYLPQRLLKTFEQLKKAERKDARAFALEMATELGAKPSVVRGKLATTYQRLAEEMWAAEVDGLSQEGKVAKVTKVIELALADLSALPAVRRSQMALKESGKFREQDARLRALILAEKPAVLEALRIRWPHRRHTKASVRDELFEKLKAHGHKTDKGKDISRKRIETELARH